MKDKDKQRAYDALPERRAARSAYKQSPAGQEADRRYRMGPAGRATRHRARTTSARALRESRQAQVDIIKLESGCVDCGYHDHAVALDFDHVRGEKVSGISTMVKDLVPWDSVLAEIAKCEVVCSNCHRVRTQKGGHYTNRLAGPPKAATPSLFDLAADTADFVSGG